MSVREDGPTASRRCEGKKHVFKDLDSAGSGVCVCGVLQAFGQPWHGTKVWIELQEPAK